MSRDLKQVTATGDVVTGPAYLHSAVLAGDGTAAVTVEIRDGSGGDVRLTLHTPMSGHTSAWTSGDSVGVLFASGIHATVTGAGATVSCEYS